MTAETLKPFITPNSSEHFPATHARPCRGQCSSKWIAMGLSVTCLVLTAVLVGVTVWQTMRITNLETNLKSLNGVVESMQKRLGLEYLDDLHEFEKEYTNALIDDPTDIDDDDDDEDDLNLDDNDEDIDDEDDDDEDIDNLDDDDDFDDDDDDDDSDIYDEMLDNYENMDAMVKKYHEDITNENIDDDVSDGGSMSTDSNVLKDFEKFNDFKKKQSTRKTRSISNASNGLPLFESSYLKQVNKTDTNEGALDVPKDNQLTEESHVVEHHHQQHQQQQHRMKKPTMRIQSTDALSHHRAAHDRHIIRESLLERRHSPLRPRTQRRRKLPLTKSGESQFAAKYTNAQTSLLSMEPLRPAAHFHLNRKVPDRHAAIRVDSYPGDMYIGAPSWSHEFDIEHYFHVDQGVLTVREPGLYYIYAQVCYNNSHDQNGFVIFHGHKPYLQCLNTVPTNMPLKIHTCHTSGLVHLRANDTMHLRDFHSDRNVILKDTNNRSYFGLMKV